MVFSVSNGDRLYHTDINVISVVQKFSIKSGCEVTPTGGMDVNVADGIVLFNGEVHSISATTVSIPTADASYPRIDLVVYDGSNVTVLQGTAAEDPKPPAYDVESYVVLARVYVSAGATEITASDIKDMRVMTRNGVVVIDAVIPDDYDTIYDAFNAGARRIYVRAGNHSLGGNITVGVNDYIFITGEGYDSVINVGSYSITVQGQLVTNTGTVSVTNGSATVTGSGTSFVSDGVQVGDYFARSNYGIKISSVDSETQLTLESEWRGWTFSGGWYSICRHAYGYIENVRFVNSVGATNYALASNHWGMLFVNDVIFEYGRGIYTANYGLGKVYHCIFRDEDIGTCAAHCYECIFENCNYGIYWCYKAVNCGFASCETGIHLKGGEIINCNFFDCDKSVVVDSTYGRIDSCKFGNTTYGVYMDVSGSLYTDIRVNSCFFRCISNTGIIASDRWVISNCEFRNISSGTGIRVYNASDTTITGNMFYYVNTCIDIDSSDRVTVTGNSFDLDGMTYGVDIDSGCRVCVVSSNTFYKGNRAVYIRGGSSKHSLGHIVSSSVFRECYIAVRIPDNSIDWGENNLIHGNVFYLCSYTINGDTGSNTITDNLTI